MITRPSGYNVIVSSSPVYVFLTRAVVFLTIVIGGKLYPPNTELSCSLDTRLRPLLLIPIASVTITVFLSNNACVSRVIRIASACLPFSSWYCLSQAIKSPITSCSGLAHVLSPVNAILCSAGISSVKSIDTLTLLSSYSTLPVVNACALVTLIRSRNSLTIVAPFANSLSTNALNSQSFRGLCSFNNSFFVTMSFHPNLANSPIRRATVSLASTGGSLPIPIIAPICDVLEITSYANSWSYVSSSGKKFNTSSCISNFCLSTSSTIPLNAGSCNSVR